jgi:LCP family protein required for cell wall assembly
MTLPRQNTPVPVPAPLPPRPRRRRRRSFGPPLALAAVLLAMAAGAAHVALSHPFGAADSANVLLLGADAGADHHPLSDAMMFVRFTLRPQPSAAGWSIPRDTRVKLPDRRGFHKINAAFAFGGAALARQAVAQNLGLKADHCVVMRCAGLDALVDALGGVEIDVPEAMDYDDHAQDLHIHFKPGHQRLNGKQAEEFVRFRHDGAGDLGRMQRQHAFLKALGAQALRPAMIFRLPAVYAALGQFIDSDLSRFQLLGLAYSLRGIGREQVRIDTLPGRPRLIDGVSYFIAEAPVKARG